MKHKVAKYIKVLRAELEDLEEDLKIMAELHDQRAKRDEITGYVCRENVSVLTTEISGIKTVIQSIDSVPVEQFSDLPAFVAYLDSLLRERTRRDNYPEGVYALVKRKLEKVLAYMELEE